MGFLSVFLYFTDLKKYITVPVPCAGATSHPHGIHNLNFSIATVLYLFRDWLGVSLNATVLLAVVG